jgi:hypothetical protein
MYIKHTLNGILKCGFHLANIIIVEELNGILKCGFHLAINIIIVRRRKKTMQTKILKRMKEAVQNNCLFLYLI